MNKKVAAIGVAVLVLVGAESAARAGSSGSGSKFVPCSNSSLGKVVDDSGNYVCGKEAGVPQQAKDTP